MRDLVANVDNYRLRIIWDCCSDVPGFEHLAADLKLFLHQRSIPILNAKAVEKELLLLHCCP